MEMQQGVADRLKSLLRTAWPHLLVMLGFIVASALYFKPVLSGMELSQNDNIQAIASAHELVEYEQSTGEKAQWTDSMFGGMPSYQIRSDSSHNIFHSLAHGIRLNLPFTTIAIVFLYLMGFYVLLHSLGMNIWLSALGAVAFGFGSYNIIIIAAGHITKCYAIAMMPLVMGGVMMTFSGKRVLGGIYTMVAMGLELAYNHIQITYYLALSLLLLAIIELVRAIRAKALGEYGKSIGTLAIAVIMSILPSITNLWTTYEYGAYSIRGASELKNDNGESQGTGLDKDYALSWSYGVGETPTLLIPNIVGGASEAIGQSLGMNPKSLKGTQSDIRKAILGQSSYWGGRAFTSGPVYVGAIVCFLFFLGCFYYKGRYKWWLIGATVMSIVLAWGKNFPLLTDLMFDYFPLYNKFRTVEMALVIATVTMPLLGMLGLKQIYDYPEELRYHPAKFFVSLGLTAGVCLIIYIAPTLFYNFLNANEVQDLTDLVHTNPLYEEFRSGLINARAELAKSDAMRSAMLIMLASSAIWFFVTRKLNDKVMLSALLVLCAIDLVSIDRRYLSSDDFKPKRMNEGLFAKSKADEAILKDSEPHRVLSIQNPFNNAVPSYYHQSVGGYHGAKLRRYQDMIDNYLMPEYGAIVNAMQKQDYEGISKALHNARVLNMLNTKYVIYSPNAEPICNYSAHPRAWFVEEAQVASDATEAIKAVGEVDLTRVAVLEGATVEGIGADSASVVRQTEYAPDHIVYETDNSHKGLAVFSEIYYPAGWKASIDGKEANIVCANYILRALEVPAGHHKIEFSFEPTSYKVGNIVSTAASALVVIMAIAGILHSYRKKETEGPTEE